MANVISVTPSDKSTGVFLGQPIVVDFDELMDEETISRATFIVTGPENTLFSGHDLLLWIDLTVGGETLFDSPGFDGFLRGKISFENIDDNGNMRTRAIFTPKRNLAPMTEFRCYLYGNQGQGVGTRCIQSRSIGDLEEVIHSGTGELTVNGSYFGNKDDALVIFVTSAGDRGDAYMRYYLESNSAAVSNELLIRGTVSLPILNNSITLSFTKGSYNLDDKWRIPLISPTQMTALYIWTFTTGSQEMVTPPDITSEQVTHIPYHTAGHFYNNPFDNSLSSFPDGSVNISNNLQYFDIIVNETLDVSSVNSDTVKVMFKNLFMPFDEGKIRATISATRIENGKTQVRVSF